MFAILCCFKLNAQTIVDGEIRFRQFIWGVNNIPVHIDYSVNGGGFTQGTTTSPWCGAYSATLPLSTTQTNTVRITPNSLNTFTDFITGVSTYDVVKLERHLQGLEPYLPANPTPEQYKIAGFKLLASDANNDNTVNLADKAPIQQLILGVSSSLTRNSWEWVRDNETTLAIGFYTNPYSKTIKSLFPNRSFPNIPGRTFGRVSVSGTIAQVTNLINHIYRSSKTGDIANNGTNPMLCNTSAVYFGNENSENRSSVNVDFSEVSKGDILNLDINISTFDKLVGIELPVYVDPIQYKVLSLSSEEIKKEDIKYHHRQEDGRLTIMIINDGVKTVFDQNKGTLKLQLQVKDKNTQKENIEWQRDREIELINDLGELTKGDVDIMLISHLKSEEKIKYVSTHQYLLYQSTNEKYGKYEIIDISGRVLDTKDTKFTIGSNQIDVSHLQSGQMYFIKIHDEEKSTNYNFVKI
ncbi:MAG: hypothetical protein RLZZ546_1302 [Bacteroidota bacterium]